MSLAVITTTDFPASARAASKVGARSHLGSFIMTSVSVAWSYSVLPQMPCTFGGAPVTIDRLFGLVKLGTTQSALRPVPCASACLSQGMWPPATAWAR